MGEFDVALLIDQCAGVEVSQRLYPCWRGGYYYAARPKGDPSAPLALLYVSRWSKPEHAAEFAAVYARSLEQRYPRIHSTEEGAAPKPATYNVETLTGKHSWLSGQGPVFMDIAGDMVIITE